jgi:hypothetical protein
MASSATLLMSVLCLAFFSPLGMAQDLSKYRDFQFGMNLDAVAKQVQMKSSKTQRRAMIGRR